MLDANGSVVRKSLLVVDRAMDGTVARRDREEAVEQAHQQGAQKAAAHGDGHAERGVDHRRVGKAALVEERADDAADAADVHDAGDAEIEVAGLLGNDLTGAAEEQGDALRHGTGDEGHQIKHWSHPPSWRN